jgi:hypothetical protein
VALGLLSAAQGALLDGGALSAAQREAISQGLVNSGQYLARVTAKTAAKRRKSILAPNSISSSQSPLESPAIPSVSYGRC